MASSANQMAWLAFAPVTTGAAAHFRVPTSTIGLLSEIFPLLYVVLALPAGRAVDRSLRKWLGAGAVLSALGTVLRLAGTTRSGFAWVLAGQVVVAAAQPLLLNSVTALARRYLAPADRPVGIAIGSAGTFLGFVLAFVTGGAIGAARTNDLLALGAAYAALGGAVLVVALVLTPCPFGGERSGSLAGLAELRQLWDDPVMRGLVYLVFVGFGVFVSLTTWAQPLLQPAGVSTATADTLLTAMVLAGVATSALLPPPIARRGAQLPALVVGGVATILGCGLLAAAPGVVSGALGLCLVGLFLLPGLPVMLEVAERRSGDGAGAAAGLIWLAGQGGGIVVAVACGALEGTPWLAFSLLAIVVLSAVPAATHLRGQLSAQVLHP
ncbi:MAG TPA: MFS transporter [Acidimicrobiales bacterium]|nr:MFS transporter [Acidimicrobiales bacterium]